MARMKNILVIFKDDVTGQWSLARISGSMVLIFNLLFAAGVVCFSHKLPDLPTGWLTLILGLYGINKIATGITLSKATPEEAGK